MTAPFRLLITGTRENGEVIRRHVWEVLSAFTHSDDFPLGRTLTVVHGQCPRGGVDLYADQWAQHWGYLPEPHPADWRRHGRRAGPIRNKAMVDTRPDYCIGFPGPGSKGTWGCLQQAVDAGIPTKVHPVGPWLHRGGGE